jgi:nucleotide-binding universal stress UspA family protein
MKTSPAAVKETTDSLSLEIVQALLALELADVDHPMLDFFNFFSSQIPVGAAHLIHVLPNIDFFHETNGLSPYEIDQEVINRMEEEIKGRLPGNHSIYLQFDIKQGDPLEEILRDAEEIDADLVVMGNRSDTEVHNVPAQNLVRKVKGNALVIPDQAKPQITHILVPIDFSANSIRALQAALALNQQLDKPARITCVNVYDMPNLSVYKLGRSREQLKALIEEDRNSAFQAFLHTYAGEQEENIQTALIERDLPGISRYIYDYAQEKGADLVVMGAKGHSKVDLLLMGSVTEKWLSINDKIPSLIVK